MPSRLGGTLADRIAVHVLSNEVEDYTSYSFLNRGSDERHYCSPLIDLPVVSIMRSKYITYPEYHTSLDDLSLISPDGLADSYKVFCACLSALEVNHTYRATIPCEPQMGKRGLYPTLKKDIRGPAERAMMNFLAYADGTKDLLGIADMINVNIKECAAIAGLMEKNDLVVRVENTNPHGP